MQRQGRKGNGMVNIPRKAGDEVAFQAGVKRSELPEVIRSSREPEKVQEQPSLDREILPFPREILVFI